MLNLFVYLLILLIPLGQFSRLPLGLNGDVAVFLNDLLIPLFLLLAFVYLIGIKKRFLVPPFLGLLFFWVMLAFLGCIFSLAFGFLGSSQVLVGSLYLLRFTEYILLYAAIYNLAKIYDSSFSKTTLSLMITSGFIFAILGLLQFKYFPDFSQFAGLGWDPHYYRVLSTFFDPNFAGLFLTLTLILIIATILLAPVSKLARLFLGMFLSVIGLAIVLTFSRSTYLALATGLTVVSFFKSKKIILAGLILALLIFLFVPRVQERVTGALNIDETAKLRLENYSKTLLIIEDHWLIGVGFDNFRYAQGYYGFLSDKRGVEGTGGHSGSGSDSSLLLVLATSGVFGFAVFLIFLGCVFIKSIKLFYQSTGYQKVLFLTVLASLSAIIVHSQFVNSFFYPWIMLWFFTLLGITYGSNSD